MNTTPEGLLEFGSAVSLQIADVLSASGVGADVVLVIAPTDAEIVVAATMITLDERRANGEVKDTLERAYETVLDGGPVTSELNTVRHGPSH